MKNTWLSSLPWWYYFLCYYSVSYPKWSFRTCYLSCWWNRNDSDCCANSPYTFASLFDWYYMSVSCTMACKRRGQQEQPRLLLAAGSWFSFCSQFCFSFEEEYTLATIPWPCTHLRTTLALGSFAIGKMAWQKTARKVTTPFVCFLACCRLSILIESQSLWMRRGVPYPFPELWKFAVCSIPYLCYLSLTLFCNLIA